MDASRLAFVPMAQTTGGNLGGLSLSPGRSMTPVLGNELPAEKPMELISQSQARLSSTTVPSSAPQALKSIETELKRYGYDSIQRITIRRAHQIQSTYIKARSPLGFYVFVEVDETGYIKYSPKDLTMIESVKGTSLPISESYKRGAHDDLGNTMIMCQGGICKLDQDPMTTSVRETNYTFTSETSNETIMPENSVLAFPIVKMKEIEANPGLVLQNTAIATANLRHNAYVNCTNEIRNYMTQLEILVKDSNAFSIAQDQKAKQISADLNKLMEFQNQIQNVPQTNEEISRQRTIRFNLEDRNDLSIDLLTMCAQFKNLSEMIKTADMEVKRLNELLAVKFTGLNDVKQPPQL